MTDRKSKSSSTNIVLGMMTRNIVAANKCLHQQPVKALALYTQSAATRHPAAFLNRSICYLILNRPELAAMDAERAYRLSLDRRTVSRGSITGAQLLDYAYVCDVVERASPWATSSSSIPRGPTRPLRLTSLIITSFPPIDGPSDTAKPDAYDDLRVKSLFRLAYALWKCGGGAQRSAITILERAKSLSSGIGTTEIDWLSSEIATDLQLQFDQVRSTTGGMAELQDLMASRYAFLDRPTKKRERLSCSNINTSIQKMDCAAVIVAIETQGQRRYVSTQDIYAGDVLFTESTALSVSTASTEDAAVQRYCETCSVLMEIPDGFFDLPNGHSKADSPNRALRPISSPELVGGKLHEESLKPSKESVQQYDKATKSENGDILDGLESVSISIEETTSSQSSDQQRKYVKLSDISSRTGTDIRVCHRCQNAVYWCSRECKTLSFLTHHSLMCGTSLEEYLKDVHSSTTHASGPRPHQRIITMLLLGRLLSWAQSEDEHPLDLPAVRLLSATARSHERSTIIPWSYETHVIAPLAMLHILDAGKVNLAFDINRKDGHVIFSLIHLIASQVHISNHNAWSKKYDKNGNMVEMTVPDDRDELHTPASDQEDGNEVDRTYYGKLHPLCGLLNTASTEDVQPNVELVDLGDNRIICIPLASGRADSTSPLTTELVLPAGTHLYLASRSIRPGTLEERNKYRAELSSSGSSTVSDINIDDTLMAYEMEDDEMDENEIMGILNENSDEESG